MRLSTTTDIDTDDASATVNQIDETLTETDYRLNVTSDTVRLYATMETTSQSVGEDGKTMLSELNALDGVDLANDAIDVSGGL